MRSSCVSNDCACYYLQQLFCATGCMSCYKRLCAKSCGLYPIMGFSPDLNGGSGDLRGDHATANRASYRSVQALLRVTSDFSDGCTLEVSNLLVYGQASQPKSCASGLPEQQFDIRAPRIHLVSKSSGTSACVVDFRASLS
eukprot:5605167-Amphidinium_carterae.1